MAAGDDRDDRDDRSDRKEKRRNAVVALEKTRLRLLDAGSAYGKAIDDTSFGAFEWVDAALDGTAKDWLQDGAAFWVHAWGSQVQMYRDVYGAFTNQSPPAGPKSGFYGKTLRFFIDQHSQASAAVVTKISKTETVVATDLTFGKATIPARFVAFSGPSDDGGTYVVSLAGMRTLTKKLPAGTYKGKLTWQNQHLDVEVVLSHTRE